MKVLPPSPKVTQILSSYVAFDLFISKTIGTSHSIFILIWHSTCLQRFSWYGSRFSSRVGCWRGYNLVFLGTVFPMLILIPQSHLIFTYSDPQHSQGTMRAPQVIEIDSMMHKMEYLLHTHALVIVKTSAPVIMMNFAHVAVVLISSMTKCKHKHS